MPTIESNRVVSEDISIDRLRKERKEEYDRGYDYGIDWTKRASYETLDRVVRDVREKREDALSATYFGEEIDEKSLAFKEGLANALEHALEEVEKRRSISPRLGRPITQEWLSRVSKDWVAIAIIVIVALILIYLAGMRMYAEWVKLYGR